MRAAACGAVAVGAPELAVTDQPAPGLFEAIYRLLEASSRPVIGPATTHWLIVPLHAPDGTVSGGLWGCTNFGWLHIQMLFVPEAERGRGTGTALLAAAEAEARRRGCAGAHVDTFSFQATEFYQKCGYTVFGVLDGYPPGHAQLYFRKQFSV